VDEDAGRKQTLWRPRRPLAICAVTLGPSLRDARILRLPAPIDEVVCQYLELAHLEAPGLIQGLYLVGPVALDDFRPRTSDIDFVAVTGPEPDESALRALARVHAELHAEQWHRVVREALRIWRSDYAGPSIGSVIAGLDRDLVSLWTSNADRSLFWSPLKRRRDLLAFIDMVITAGRHLYDRRFNRGEYGDQ
jgi:hypothetical protein